MANNYRYRVLAERSDQTELIWLGSFDAPTPDAAIASAVEAGGMPRAKGGIAIAVPERSWHRRRVAIERVPEVRVTALPTDEAEPLDEGQAEAVGSES